MPTLDGSNGILASIIHGSPIGMLLVDLERRIVFANQKAVELFGYTDDELANLSIEALMPERFRQHHPEHMKRYFAEKRPRAMGESRNLKGLTKDGTEIDIEIGLSPISLEGELYVLASIIDISARREAERLARSNAELLSVAYRDPLTGLPNRRFFMEHIEELRAALTRRRGRLVVMFIDLDGFKATNDRYGHKIGDELLLEVAHVITRHVRRTDVVSRIGGDEFLVCFVDVDELFEPDRAATQLLEAIGDIEDVAGHAVDIGASIGAISTRLDETVSIEDIVSEADKLMYVSKKQGKGRATVKVFSVFPD